MKRVIKLFILLLVLIPTLVLAKDNVEISKVELVDSTEDLELEDPTYKGLETNFNIKFNKVNDYVKYKITIDNSTNKDYELSLNDFSKSEYINYDYELNNKVLSKNSSKEIFLSISYKKEIDESKYKDGVFIEDTSMKIDLGEEVMNPKTGLSYLYLILVVAVTLSITLLIYVFGSKKLNKYTISVLALFLIPISVLAIEKLELKVNARIEVSNTKEFCVRINDERAKYYTYISNMTWEEYLISDYNEFRDYSYDPLYDNPFFKADHFFFIERGQQDYNVYDTIDEELTNTIKDKSLGCYIAASK